VSIFGTMTSTEVNDTSYSFASFVQASCISFIEILITILISGRAAIAVIAIAIAIVVSANEEKSSLTANHGDAETTTGEPQGLIDQE
jgi:hypothetical protein